MEFSQLEVFLAVAGCAGPGDVNLLSMSHDDVRLVKVCANHPAQR